MKTSESSKNELHQLRSTLIDNNLSCHINTNPCKTNEFGHQPWVTGVPFLTETSVENRAEIPGGDDIMESEKIDLAELTLVIEKKATQLVRNLSTSHSQQLLTSPSQKYSTIASRLYSPTKVSSRHRSISLIVKLIF